MFYKKLSDFKERSDLENVGKALKDFDFWLATLPRHNRKNITASMVSARLDINYMLADIFLRYAKDKGILQQGFLVRCPQCDYSLGRISKDQIPDITSDVTYCDECNEDRNITTSDIYIVYDLVREADISEEIEMFL